MNISDPLSVNERAYRTNIIKFTAKSLEVRSESEDFIEYNKKENKVSILCNSENVLFNDKKCLFVSFELYDLSCKYNSLISCLGGNCRLKKIVLQENSNKD